MLRTLHFQQPTKRFQAYFNRSFVARLVAADDQCLREPGVIVARLVLEPRPVFCGCLFVQVDKAQPSASREPGGRVDRRVNLRKYSLMPKAQTPRSGAKTASTTPWQRATEHFNRPILKVCAPASPDASTQSPQRPAKTVVRSLILEPNDDRSHEVAKPTLVGIVSGVAQMPHTLSPPEALGRLLAQLLEQHR